MADVSLLEAPPHAVDVQNFSKARNAELLSLHAALKKRTFSQQDAGNTPVIASTVLSRHLRRRTCSYIRRHRSLSWIYRKNNKVQQPRKKQKIDNSSTKPKSDKTSFGVSSQVDQNGPYGNGVEPVKKRRKVCRALRRLIEFKHGAPLVSNDGTRRLATHVWHAKRFSMEKKWGFYIPVGRPGRGHGSRSVLRWSKEAALLQDASFFNAIQISGPEEKLLQILSLMVEPTEDVNYEHGVSQPMCSAGYFTNALLYHVGKAPCNLIAPVLIVWKSEANKSMASFSISEVDNQQYHLQRDLWLWVHAAAFKEALQALQLLCNELNKDSNDDILKCFSRQGDLGRLDLVGKKSFDVLQKIIFPVHRNKYNKSIKLYELSKVVGPNNIENIMSMEVLDPRLNENERSYLCTSCSVQSSANSQLNHESAEGIVTELEEGSFGLASDILWEYRSSRKICHPAREKFYSKMRHVGRIASFGLKKTNASDSYTKTLSEKMTCPIMLLKNNSQVPSSCWWSIILPLSWVPAFWVPLVFAGGHVIGERERHWLCNDAGYASFPDDFPDCLAYSELMSTDNAMELGRHLTSSTDSGISLSDEVRASHFESSRTSEKGRSFVARTAAQLQPYLTACQSQRLLLFPAAKHVADKTKTLKMRLREGMVAWSPRSTQIVSNPRTCWLRVLVRPFRKGVTDMGAMLYSPTSEDYAKYCFLEEVEEKPSDSSREMVGFVTSTCPRGSKNGASIAICDAIALGHIRGRQWVETSWYKNSEIFLLFCNKRSSTFRPAFASIVLERAPDV